MSALVTLTIDDVPVSVPEGTNVVDAARQVGIEIPVFCHHPRLKPVGMCRMCLVEVGLPARSRDTGELERDPAGQPVIRFGPAPVTGCTTRVSPGMVVRTRTPLVREAQASVLELLLTSHPLDCPVCDKGGECPLQNLTMRHGPGTSRFAWADKFHFEKPVPCGPLVLLDRERCIYCARCIRFLDEIADDPVLGFDYRGRAMAIITSSLPPFDSTFSGNTTDICPVGALTARDFRFKARPWEVVGCPGICAHCAAGCNVTYDVRSGVIQRVMPRRNEAVNEIWLCDKGRYAHHYASTPDRLTTPLVRRKGRLAPATWDEALGVVADRLAGIRASRGPGAIGGLAAPSAPNEDLYVLGRFMRAVLGTNNVDHVPAVIRDDTIARAPARVDLTRVTGATAVIVVGLDPAEEAPILYLNLRKAIRADAAVIVVGGRPQKLERYARAVIRTQYGAERDAVADLVSGVERGRRGDAATDAIATAEQVIVLYGLEAVRAGVTPSLEALVGAARRTGRPGSGLLAVGRHANAQGAGDMGIMPDWLPGYRPLATDSARRQLGKVWPAEPPSQSGLPARRMLSGGVDGLVILGSDPAGCDARFRAALEAVGCLVVIDLFLTETAGRAHVVLPLQSPPEREGTFTSCTRRVQRSWPAARPVGESLPGWAILGDLGRRLGAVEPFDTAADVRAEIAWAVPQYAGCSEAPPGGELCVPAAGPLDPFAPFTPSRDVEYEGTRYDSGAESGWRWDAPGAPALSGEWHGVSHDGPRSPSPRGLVLVREPRLYDGGRWLAASDVLRPLVAAPCITMSPDDAAASGLSGGRPVRATTPHGAVDAVLAVRPGVPKGVVLLTPELAWESPVCGLWGDEHVVSVAVERLGAA